MWLWQCAKQQKLNFIGDEKGKGKEMHCNTVLMISEFSRPNILYSAGLIKSILAYPIMRM